MQTPDCLLTLVFPRGLEEQIIDFMLVHEAQTSGFICGAVSGHGANAVYASAGEKVRGMAQQMRLTAVLGEADARALLADLKTKLGQANIVYWLSPLIAYGSFV